MNNQKQSTAKQGSSVAIGQRITLARDVERFPHFIAKKGATGTINALGGFNHGMSAKMDEKLEGCEEWDNCIIWQEGEEGDDFNGDVVGMHEPTARCDCASCAAADGNRLIEKPIRVYMRKVDGSGFFFMNDTLYSAAQDRGGDTLDMDTALPVNEWESDPLDEAGWQEICAALGKPVPAIRFEANIRFNDCTIKRVEGRGNDYVEGNAVDLINQFTALNVNSVFTVEQRRAMVAAVIHALGHLLFAQPDATHRQVVLGNSLHIRQIRG